MGAMGRAESLAVLDAAYEAGIRHFDVAPMYGYGQAEGVLGEFISRHPGQVTVTTKYGIPPATQQGLIGIARSLARPVVRAVPGLKRGLTSAAVRVTGAGAKAAFTAAEARESLERSLCELRTDHIDIWLLHEATPADLHDPALLSLMQESLQAGKIGAFGVGSGRAEIEAIGAVRPEYLPVTQFSWSVLDAPLPPTRSMRILHRALTENFRDLHRQLLTDRARCNRWSSLTGADLADARALGALMLKAALLENSSGIVLFSSKSPRHIQENVSTARNSSLEAPARRLYKIIQEERLAVTQERAAG